VFSQRDGLLVPGIPLSGFVAGDQQYAGSPGVKRIQDSNCPWPELFQVWDRRANDRVGQRPSKPRPDRSKKADDMAGPGMAGGVQGIDPVTDLIGYVDVPFLTSRKPSIAKTKYVV
jgi:hypothetical protein